MTIDNPPVTSGPRTRKLIIPAETGYNSTDGNVIYPGDSRGLEFPDAKDCFAVAHFEVPQDFSSGMTVTPVVRSSASGNIYVQQYIKYGGEDEDYDDNDDSPAPGAEALVGGMINDTIDTVTLTAEAAGDMVSVHFRRNGTEASDDLSASIWFVGWGIEYTADS